MNLPGLMVRFAALPGPVRSGIWMSVSAITYVVSIAIGRYLAPSIEVFQIAFLRNAFAILFMMFCVLILLGMFMDATSMMLITVPIFFPLAGALGFDLIWYGLFVLITIEMAGTTPPFGLLLYVMLGVAPKGTTLIDVAKAAFPFLVCDTILILILIAWPNLALWLPSLM